MSERYETLKPDIAYRSAKTEALVLKLWQKFFARIAKLPIPIDRAVWIFICNRDDAWVGVKPGNPEDDLYEEPHFVLSARVKCFDEVCDAILSKQAESVSVTSPVMQKMYGEYERWLRDAVKVTFQSPQIEKLRKAYSKKNLAVYWTNIEDLHTTEIDEMKWLAGSKLKSK